MTTLNAKTRFKSKVNKQGSYPSEEACAEHPEIEGTRCYEWTASLFEGGYGQFWDGTYLENGNPRMVGAHCFSYELKHGEGSLGKKQCCHKCDNEKCVRQSHLFKDTAQGNSDDKVAKGRSRGGSNKGEKQGSSKLTTLRVRVIRSLYALGEHTQKELGKMFGVGAMTIFDVIHRKTWLHVR
jgi:hypothetical protein